MIEICVTVAATPPSVQSVVRFWVEPVDGDAIGDEVEVPMSRGRSGEWRGDLSQHALGRSGSLLYRLALLSVEDVAWSLEITDRRTRRALVRDADRTAFRKTWLVGTCSLDRAAFDTSNVIALCERRPRAER